MKRSNLVQGIGRDVNPSVFYYLQQENVRGLLPGGVMIALIESFAEVWVPVILPEVLRKKCLIKTVQEDIFSAISMSGNLELAKAMASLELILILDTHINAKKAYYYQADILKMFV